MSKLEKGDQIELTIDRLSYNGGRGVGRYEGLVVFVPATAPGDQVTAQITDIKKNFAEAKIISINQKSPHRRNPPCPVAETCGGCSWQHIEYSEQIKQKYNLLVHQLKRVLVANKSRSGQEVNVPPITASPREFRYRNRVQIHYEYDPSQMHHQSKFGFFAKGTNLIVPITDCLISDERLFTDLESELKNEIFNQHKIETPNRKLEKFEIAIDSQQNRVIRRLRSEESEFTQVNTDVNLLMRQHVVAQLQLHKSNTQHIHDLYCGDGNLSFPILEQFTNSQLIGVELSASAIARANARLSKSDFDSKNVQFKNQNVADYLNQVRNLNPSTTFVVDPPRAGLENSVIDHILRLKPRVVIYVSCSLPTLARDLEKLTTYNIVTLQGFDMFPQTEYIETVVTLTLRH